MTTLEQRLRRIATEWEALARTMHNLNPEDDANQIVFDIPPLCRLLIEAADALAAATRERVDAERLERVLAGLREPVSIMFTEKGLFIETQVQTIDGPSPEMAYGRLALTVKQEESDRIIAALRSPDNAK